MPKRPRIDIIHERTDNPHAQRLVLQTIRTPATRHRLLERISPEETPAPYNANNISLISYSAYRRFKANASLTERFGYNENARASYDDEDEN